MAKKKTSKQLSPSGPKTVLLNFPGWVFWSDAPENETIIVRVRLLGTKERDALEAFLLPLDLAGFAQRLIWLSLVDKDGNRVFSESDEAVLRAASSTPVFALARAILEANGMIPPPDQKVDHAGDAYSIDNLIDSLVDATRSKYPAWSQEKIDEYRGYMESTKAVFSFLRSYAKKYSPGSEKRDHLLGVVPSVPEEQGKDALARQLERHPFPIFFKRWEKVGWYVMRGLAADAVSEGKPIEEVKKERLLNSLKAAIVKARRETGIWATEEEWNRKFKPSYRKEAETDLRIPKESDAFSYLKTEELPEEPEEEEESDLVEGEELTKSTQATAKERQLAELVERLDLWKRFERLSPENKKTIQVLFENGQDYRKTAKALEIEEATLRQRISRMKEEKNPRRRKTP